MIEDGDRDKIVSYLRERLSFYKGKVFNVVLGCTHYPLVKDIISDILGDVKFFDGSIGVSKRLFKVICDNGFVSSGDGKIIFMDSSGSVKKRDKFYYILECDDYE